MSTAEDLEKELTCAVCTNIFYHPLTLLDCLHTFCGSCIVPWFRSSMGSNPNARPSCPSCRASVRTTKHDARASSLLELIPKEKRERTEEDKLECEAIYKPGDVVLVEGTTATMPFLSFDSPYRTLYSLTPSGIGGRPPTLTARTQPSSAMPRIGHQRAPSLTSNLGMDGFPVASQLGRAEPVASPTTVTRSISITVSDRWGQDTTNLPAVTPLNTGRSVDRPAQRLTPDLVVNDDLVRQQWALLESARLQHENSLRRGREMARMVELQRTTSEQVRMRNQWAQLDSARIERERRREEELARSRVNREHATAAANVASGGVARTLAAPQPTWPGAPHGSVEVEGSMRRRSAPPTARDPRELHTVATASVVPTAINCSICGRPDIHRTIHYHCGRCEPNFDICRECYRRSHRCPQYHTADHSHRLLLSIRRYFPTNGLAGFRTQHGATVMVTSPLGRSWSTEDGVFCDVCDDQCARSFFACTQCNALGSTPAPASRGGRNITWGWAFCQSCVASGRSCDHALLAMSRPQLSTPSSMPSSLHPHAAPGPRPSLSYRPYSTASTLAFDPANPPPPSSPPAADVPTTLTSDQILARGSRDITIINFQVVCDLCRRQIGNGEQFAHCVRCGSNDFDVCSSCIISRRNLPFPVQQQHYFSWERRLQAPPPPPVAGGPVIQGMDLICPSEHPCQLVQFDAQGMRHVLVPLPLNLSTAVSIPARPGLVPGPAIGQFVIANDPDCGQPATALQGTKKAVVAVSGNFPTPTSGDGEVMFPRGARLRAVRKVNEEWWHGYYAGRAGIFRSRLVRIVDLDGGSALPPQQQQNPPSGLGSGPTVGNTPVGPAATAATASAAAAVAAVAGSSTDPRNGRRKGTDEMDWEWG